jgi:hypothetical protein
MRGHAQARVPAGCPVSSGEGPGKIVFVSRIDYYCQCFCGRKILAIIYLAKLSRRTRIRCEGEKGCFCHGE